MNKTFLTLIIGAAVIASCTNDNEWESYANNSNGTSGGTASATETTIGTLTSFDIAIDTTALAEDETIDSEDEDYVENNTFTNDLYIIYNGTQATVSGSVEGVDVAVSGADVTVTSTVKKVAYHVSGTTTDGFLKIYSDYKYALSLEGASITNPNGAAINLQSKKRAYLLLADGTTNTLTDGTSYTDETSDEDMKATLFTEGKLLVSGTGSLHIQGNCKAALRSDDYILFRPGVNVYAKATAGNAIKANDGIYIRGGVVNAETSATASHALSCDGEVAISGGRTTLLTTGGGTYDSDERDASASSAIKVDSTFTMCGGSLYCKSTGAGGKGLSVDQTTTISGGTVRIITTGKQYTYGSSSALPKGIKSDGALTISGGDIMVRTTGGEGSEGIESKSTMDITGGVVQVYAYDDALNSSGAMTISGGYIFGYGINNDGIDSNSTLTITGGVVIGVGTTSPEDGFDCDENTFTITGGTVIGIGGGTSTPTTSTTKQPVAIYGGSSLASGTYLTVNTTDGTNILAFCVPRAYNSYTLLLSSPSLTQGSTYTLASGATVSGGTDFNGYVSGATVGGGSTLTTLSLSSMVTSVNFSGGMGGGDQGGTPGSNQGGGGRPGGR